MVDPGCGARCAIRDTGAAAPARYHWTVTVFEETGPAAEGGTGELAEARSRAEGGARSRPSTDPVLVLPADRDPMPRGGRWEGYPRRRSPLALARACHDRQAKRSYATAVKEMSSRMAEVARLVLQAHPEELPRRAGRSRAATRGPSQGLHLRRSELVRTAIPSTHP